MHSSFIRFWLPVILYCTAIFVQSSFPSPLPLSGFALSDKLVHALAYAILGVLICRAANTVERWHRQWGALFVIGVCAATLYGITDEFHQSFVIGRSAEIADAMANFAGSVLGCGVYLGFFRQ